MGDNNRMLKFFGLKPIYRNEVLYENVIYNGEFIRKEILWDLNILFLIYFGEKDSEELKQINAIKNHTERENAFVVFLQKNEPKAATRWVGLDKKTFDSEDNHKIINNNLFLNDQLLDAFFKDAKKHEIKDLLCMHFV